MYLEVETNESIVLALGMGLVLVLIIFLSHIEGSRPRPMESSAIRAQTVGFIQALRSIPWMISLLILSSIVFGLLYYGYRIIHPPTF